MFALLDVEGMFVGKRVAAVARITLERVVRSGLSKQARSKGFATSSSVRPGSGLRVLDRRGLLAVSGTED